MRIRSLVVFVLLVALALLPIGCSQSPQTDEPSSVTQPSDETPDTPAVAVDSEPLAPVEDEVVAPTTADVAAYVNGDAVTTETFERAKDAVIVNYQQIYSQFGQDVRDLLNGPDGRVFELGIELEAVDIATYRVLIQGALEEHGIEVTDAEVVDETDRQFDEYLASQDMTREQFSSMLEAQSYSMDEMMTNVRKSVRDQMELEAAQRAIAGEFDYVEEDLLAYFNENADTYAVEEEVKASHILVATEADAQQILDELSNGADFAELASSRSIDTGTAVRGGSLGWFGRGMMVPEFEEAVFGLEVGEISAIVQTDYGFHIILLADYREAADPDFETSRAQIIEDYEKGILDNAFRVWYETARAEAVVEIAMPLLDAYRVYQEDPDAGFQGYLDLRAEGAIDDPVLNFLIGKIYQEKLEVALTRREELEVADSSDEGVAAELAELEQQIPVYRMNAIESLQAALVSYGGTDPSILQRIQDLQGSQETQEPEETQDDAATETSDSQ